MRPVSQCRLCRLAFLLALALVTAPRGEAQRDLPSGSGECIAAGGHTREALIQSLLARGIAAPGPGGRGAPLVQVVYLVPADRNEHPLYVQSLDASIRHLQEWYYLEMPGGETFTLAEPAILTLHSTHPEAWYREHNAHNGFTTFYSNAIDDALALMGEPPGFNPERIWLIYPDADPGCGQCGGCGAGFTTGGGFAVISANDLRGFLGGPWVRQCEGDVITYGFRPCRFVGGMGHEAGHAFGLPHPPECEQGLPSCDNAALMWAGFYGYPVSTLVPADQATLGAHPFFTPQTFDGVLPDCDAFVPADVVYLLEPHDGRYGGPSPYLVWGDVEEAPAHTVEVATDATFADVVFATTTGDEWVRFVDPGSATEYHWRVRRAPAGPWSEVRRFSMDVTVAAEVPAAPAAFRLDPPAPNPARGRVTVRFALPAPGPAVLALYDVLGRRVGTPTAGRFPQGTHAVTLETTRLPAGAYVLRLEAGGYVRSQRLIVMR